MALLARLRIVLLAVVCVVGLQAAPRADACDFGSPSCDEFACAISQIYICAIRGGCGGDSWCESVGDGCYVCRGICNPCN